MAIALGSTLLRAAETVPEIAHLHPDELAIKGAPLLITGEHFEAKSQVVTWQPPSAEQDITAAMNKLGQPMPSLPTEPPKGTARPATLLDVEPQTIVAQQAGGSLIWVKNAAGWSAPVLFNVARPFWISRQRIVPGQVIYAYGFGLRVPFMVPRIAMKGSGGVVEAKLVRMPREERIADPRLVHFQVPADAAPGDYKVFFHNGVGGVWGWRGGMTVTVAVPDNTPRVVVDVRTYGGKGDGIADETAAMKTAVDAAAQLKGIVAIPPGTWRVSETIIVPSNVTLRGSGAENCVILGTGYNPLVKRHAWDTGSTAPGASVIMLAGKRIALEGVSVRGAVSKGVGGNALVESQPAELTWPPKSDVEDVRIERCLLDAREDMANNESAYGFRAFAAGPKVNRLQFISNEIFGYATMCRFGDSERLDVIDNRVHGGSFAADGCRDSLFDGNFFFDAPQRLCVYPLRHCHFRFNEIHMASRSGWNNAEEIFLVHGAAPMDFGFPASAAAGVLHDPQAAWKPGAHKGHWVLLIAGRGFGQYREVLDNTADTLTLAQPWRVPPDQTTEYVVGRNFVESDYFANVNDTPLRTSFWLNCISIVLDHHRDRQARSADVWGQDRSVVKPDGTVDKAGHFFPAYYVTFYDGWHDSSYLQLYATGNPAAVHRGPAHFGSYVIGNRLIASHLHSSGWDTTSPARSRAAIEVGLDTGMSGPIPGAGATEGKMPENTTAIGLTHSVIAGNYIAHTPNGIRVSNVARKTIIAGNEFQEVERPLIDFGKRTLQRGDTRFISDEQGERIEKIPDRTNDADFTPPPGRDWKTLTFPKTSVSRLMDEVQKVRLLVSVEPFSIYRDPGNAVALATVRANLVRLWDLLRNYDARHGGLPGAAFFPDDPAHAADSLVTLLDESSRPLLLNPICGPELTQIGLHYVWNEKVSGRRLAALKSPAETWLLMDIFGTHDFLVLAGHAGWDGKIPVLFADGHVALQPPPNDNGTWSWRAWAESN
jgi:prepilin-type processing-associated H-X9-DG protein